MAKILIADDHALIRYGLRQIISEQTQMEIVGEASNAAGILALVHQQEWDLLVLDISMPGRNGLEVLKIVKQAYPRRPVLILSVHPEDQFAPRAFKAGAAGYLTKESAPEELMRAMTTILAGRKYVSAALAAHLAGTIGADHEQPPHTLLSDREYEIMQLLAMGKPVSHVATHLTLSVKTISTYRTRLLAKLRLKNNAELMRYALEHCLVG
jgi:two-component system invasion response regulator UvrY